MRIGQNISYARYMSTVLEGIPAFLYVFPNGLGNSIWSYAHNYHNELKLSLSVMLLIRSQAL